MEGKKPFGLVIPKKAKALRPNSGGIFGSDSDDDASTSKKKSTKIPQSKLKSSKHITSKEEIDPSIYEYDSIYDDMKAEKAAETAPKVQKSSRYIDHLLKAADKRKKEYERRVEKKVQVEREKEGDKFKDKEMFVTAAYKKKVQEREEEEERERRENMLNDMMDVTKQKDLSGFYRHFLKQTVGEEKIPVFGERTGIKEEQVSDPEEEQVDTSSKDNIVVKTEELYDDRDLNDEDSSSSENSDQESGNAYEKSMREYRQKPNKVQSNADKRSPQAKRHKNLSNSDSEEHSDINILQNKKSKQSKIKDKKHLLSAKDGSSSGVQLRKNSSSSDSKHEHTGQNKSEKVRNLNAMQSKTRQDSNSEDESDSSLRKSTAQRKSKRNASGDRDTDLQQKKARLDSDSSEVSDSLESEVNKADQQQSSATSNGVEKNPENKENDASKKSRNIFEKRTVGDAFAAAQARYFQRLAARSG